MYRNVILEFLTTKHLELNKNNYFQMTICKLGQKYDNEMLKLAKKEDIISIYHIKEPRIYHKEISFDVLENNIVMMAIDLKQEIKFNKKDLNFMLNDPFYLKDLQKQEFMSLVVTPVIEDENVIGVVITYYNQENGYIKYTNNELLKLFNNLTIDSCKSFENKLLEELKLENELLLVASNSKEYYLNQSLRNYLHIEDAMINRMDNKKNAIVEEFISQIGISTYTYENLTIYYIEKFKLLNTPNNNCELLAIKNINNNDLIEKFTYIFVKKNIFTNNDQVEDTLVNIAKRLMCTDYKLYEFNDETTIMLMNKSIISKDVVRIRNLFNSDYVMVLRGTKEITNKMNLKQLSSYLFDMLPDIFDLDIYIKWVNQRNIERLSYDDKFKDNKYIYEVVNSLDQNKLCEMSYLPLRLTYRNDHYHSYISSVERELAFCIKQSENKIFLTIPLSLLKKRKTYEDIKKIIQHNELWINVICQNEENPQDFLKLVSKYKKLKLMLCCDSSIYLNYFYMNALPLFDALYIQDYEYTHIRTQEVGLPQLIFDYAIKTYKYLIFENFMPDSNYDYNHFNCYYVQKKAAMKG